MGNLIDKLGVDGWEYRLDEMSMRDLHNILKSMAEEIEANREEIEKMSEPKQVFIVTIGVYSDYAIMCVCSSREVAERFIEEAGYEKDAARIEVYGLDCPRNEGCHLYEVEIDISTRTVKLELCMFAENDDHNTLYGDNDRPRLSDNGKSLVWGYMRTKSKEHAAKVANEKVSAVIACGSLIPVPGKDGFWQWREKELSDEH